MTCHLPNNGVCALACLVLLLYSEAACPSGWLQAYDGHCDLATEYPGRCQFVPPPFLLLLLLLFPPSSPPPLPPLAPAPRIFLCAIYVSNHLLALGRDCTPPRLVCAGTYMKFDLLTVFNGVCRVSQDAFSPCVVAPTRGAVNGRTLKNKATRRHVCTINLMNRILCRPQSANHMSLLQ